MHQIRQKNQNPAKEMQPDRRSTSTDERCASDERARRSRLAISSIAPRDRRSRRAISSIAPVDRRSRRAISSIVDRAGAIVALSSLSLSLIWAFSSLSLSLFFRKSFEVKMRGVTDFRVKGEKIGQPEVIFRKMIFSVTAKHAEKGENDVLKSFSPKTNAPLVALTHFWASIFYSLYFH